MKALFTVGTEEQIKLNDILFLEIGKEYAAYAFMDQEHKAFDLVEYISFNEMECEEKIISTIDKLKTFNPNRVIISSAFKEALLIPQNYFSENHSFIADIYSPLNFKTLDDKIAEWQIITSYGIPESIFNALQSTFVSTEYQHVYTCSVKRNNEIESFISVHFNTHYFRVMIKKNNQVQLAQTYSYKTPLDVIYYLLKLSYEFSLSQSEVLLIVSGLVESDSALYQEIKNYFLNVEFSKATEYFIPKNDHPHYYFSSLYNLAECVL